MLRRFFQLLVILPIRCYQYVISPLFPRTCRHTPSCSHYAVEAVKVHGPLKGTWLGIKRLVSCHPFGSGGYDPVPEKELGTPDVT